jgi:hypothetical protein
VGNTWTGWGSNPVVFSPWDGRSPVSHPTCDVPFPPRRPPARPLYPGVRRSVWDPEPSESGSVIGADWRRFGPSCVLPKGVPQGHSPPCVGPRAPRCHPEEALYSPTISPLLIVNTLLSLSLSLSLNPPPPHTFCLDRVTSLKHAGVMRQTLFGSSPSTTAPEREKGSEEGREGDYVRVEGREEGRERPTDSNTYKDQTLSLSLSLSHTHTHTHSLSFTLSLSHSLTLTHSHIQKTERVVPNGVILSHII